MMDSVSNRITSTKSKSSHSTRFPVDWFVCKCEMTDRQPNIEKVLIALHEIKTTYLYFLVKLGVLRTFQITTHTHKCITRKECGLLFDFDEFCLTHNFQLIYYYQVPHKILTTSFRLLLFSNSILFFIHWLLLRTIFYSHFSMEFLFIYFDVKINSHKKSFIIPQA